MKVPRVAGLPSTRDKKKAQRSTTKKEKRNKRAAEGQEGAREADYAMYDGYDMYGALLHFSTTFPPSVHPTLLANFIALAIGSRSKNFILNLVLDLDAGHSLVLLHYYPHRWRSTFSANTNNTILVRFFATNN
jgi:hypothetical protein